ncbi:hypothetical protein RCH06_003025, partial [Polaromonas sp. CG_9.5]|uniref:hypothetical protein n=1 Tax=Polaromonas sp. CG_9.5 TaxID=3071705 RepID=UPI002E017F91|nr:hypothetical protein [Polaromonas sp. CG_9.5]
MAFDLHKLVRAAEFSVSLGSLGLVRCKSLTSSLISEARRRLKAPDTEGKELVTLPPENVSLAEWFNSDKENENDKDIKGQVH